MADIPVYTSPFTGQQIDETAAGGAQHASAHAALLGFVPDSWDARFAPPLPLTGTWMGKAFTFTYTVDGRFATTLIDGHLKTVTYRADGAILSYN